MVAKKRVALLVFLAFFLGLAREVDGRSATSETTQEGEEDPKARGAARTLKKKKKPAAMVRTMKPRAVRTTKPKAKMGHMCVATSKAPSRTSMGRPTGKGNMKRNKGCATHALDVNGDGAVNLEDLTYVLRSIDDPFKDPQFVNNTAGDVNKDGVVDLQDAITMIANLTEVLGADAMGGLTPAYFDNITGYNLDQPPSDDRRRLHPGAHQGPPADPEAADVVLSRQTAADTCGASSAPPLAKGTGPDPKTKWDFKNCVYKPGLWESLSPIRQLRAKADWVAWGAAEVSFRSKLPDGMRAYRRYRENTGVELSIDYEKAIKEDRLISSKVGAEIDAVKTAVKVLFDGQNSFNFYSTKNRRVDNGKSENWQKAIGGHRIWSVGSVAYNAGSCSLTVEFTIKAEDYYNFNPGQRDIVTGIPDGVNCFFGEIGWAKGFYSRGSVTRTETVPLQCCQDTDCGRPDEFECECNLCTTQCPTNQRSGGQGFTSFTVELFKSKGKIDVSYDMYDIPDELNIYYEGSKIFSTGGLVSGGATRSVNYGSNTTKSTVVTVEINAPESGTAWDVSVKCPD